MKKLLLLEKQIVTILELHESGETVKEICRERRIYKSTFKIEK